LTSPTLNPWLYMEYVDSRSLAKAAPEHRAARKNKFADIQITGFIDNFFRWIFILKIFLDLGVDILLIALRSSLPVNNIILFFSRHEKEFCRDN